MLCSDTLAKKYYNADAIDNNKNANNYIYIIDAEFKLTQCFLCVRRFSIDLTSFNVDVICTFKGDITFITSIIIWSLLLLQFFLVDIYLKKSCDLAYELLPQFLLKYL